MVTPTIGTTSLSPRVWFTVIICGLGYFVDVYDLILFSIVKNTSLTDIGVSAAHLQDASELILGAQMVGMLVGGIIFGVLADKRGRLSILMTSILLYSLMNIANAFVGSVEVYALFRFLSGVGLAGELGVAITLVAEIMPSDKRGYGTTVVATLGILGAVAAYLVHELFNWQTAFVIGGLMGLALLAARVRVFESGMFKTAAEKTVTKGNLLMLLTKQRIGRYLSCVAIGLPVWYVIGILVTFSAGFTAESGSIATVVDGQSVMWAYVGLAAGDLLSGLLSQLLRSRKRAILLFLLLTLASAAWYLLTPDKSATMTYLQCAVLGFGVGYWAVFVTTAAEQFGTNLRATVATTVPNLVRGSLFPALALFGYLRKYYSETQTTPRVSSAIIVGGITFFLAFVGWYFLKETYGKDLDYVER
ncbi:MAG: MFS transporter [bacterium]|nr:MFS transporter [bacterium]